MRLQQFNGSKNKKNNKLLQSKKLFIKYWFYTKFNILTETKYKKNKIIILYSDKNYKNNNFFKKLNKIILKENNKVVLSNELCELVKTSKYQSIIDYLERQKQQKENFIIHIESVLSYVLKIQNRKIEEVNLYLLCNKHDLLYKYHIIDLTKKCKSINIITPSVEDFKSLEDALEEKGIFVTVSNNKRKGIIKANFIINIDFEQEEISKYNINRDAIILNISQYCILKLPGFEGIVINNARFIQKGKSLSRLLDRRFGKIYDCNFEIDDLVGNNGSIFMQEFKKLNKIKE